MTTQLRGKSADESFTNYAWYNLLRLAKLSGWKPTGTKPPEFFLWKEMPERGRDQGHTDASFVDRGEGVGDEMGEWARDEEHSFSESEWGGWYCSNDYQRVTEEDARNMADALEKALADIPDHAPDVSEKRQDTDGKNVGPDGLRPEDLPKWFGGEGKQMVKDLINLCRVSGFIIS